MKHLLSIAAAICGLATFAAPQTFRLSNGDNFVNGCGEIVGIECMTVDASQSVTANVELAITEYTNAYRAVTTSHTRYDFVITNYDGGAAIATNILDSFSYADWTRGSTNLIVGGVSAVRTNITDQVLSGRLPKATYTKTIAIGNGTASGHYLLITPASTLNYFGGTIAVQCGEGDNLTILVK